MTKSEFLEVFNDFSRSYGMKYPEPQVQLLWDYVKDIGSGQLDQALGGLIEKNARPPAVALIKDACRKFVVMAENQRKEREINKMRVQVGQCPYCLTTGLLAALKLDSDAAPYAFRCHNCSAAEILKLSKHIPIWEPRLETIFKVIRA